MCGIIGALSLRKGGFIESDLKVANSLMFMNTVRGVHGHGWMAGSSRSADKGKLSKRDFFMGKSKFVPQIDLNLDPAKGEQFLVGHCRAATVGKVHEQAAHPFRHFEVCGVHNGTVRYAANDLRRYIGQYNPFSDSDAIYRALAIAEPDDHHRIIGSLDGSYALVWYDARTNALNFVRNLQRPLVFCQEDKHTWWFASEAGYLAASVSRRYTSQPLDTHGKFIPWTIKPQTMITIPLDRPLESTTKQVVEDSAWGWNRGEYTPAKRPGQYERQCLPAPTNVGNKVEEKDLRPSSAGQSNVVNINRARKNKDKEINDHLYLFRTEGDLKRNSAHPCANYRGPIAAAIYDFLGGSNLGANQKDTVKTLSEWYGNVMTVLAVMGYGEGKSRVHIAFGLAYANSDKIVHAVAMCDENFFKQWINRRNQDREQNVPYERRSTALVAATPRGVIAYSWGALALGMVIDEKELEEDMVMPLSDVVDDVESDMVKLYKHPHWDMLYRNNEGPLVPWSHGWPTTH